MKTRIIYLCLLVIFSTTGCIPTQTIKGDGNITTENIPVSEYDCLELEGGGMVVIADGDGCGSFVIHHKLPPLSGFLG